MTTAPDLLCLGEPMVELNQHEAGGPYVAGFGGDVSNVAVAAARQGARAGMLTALGADAFGEQLHALWVREGVDASAVRTDPDAPTGLYFVSHGPSGHAFSYRRAGSAASRYGPSDLPQELLGAAKALHFSAISQAISTNACDACFAAAETVRAAGGLVSYDTNLRLALWPLARARAVIRASVALADIVLPGLDDARQITGLDDPDAIADDLLGLGAKIVALTLGAAGVLVASAERRERIGAHRVTAVDATGAGDAFDGAFLAEYLACRDAFAAARHANAAAALSVTGYGAVAPLPTRAEVVRFLGA
ncbi:sugar kinase [Polymorphum gilvum]|uniref:Sugar kinase, ribokinase family n=1 Tax=Polymorphum gilvum (strain LMG 25793 / CGMCC 1.9160 / SL003B-26A1) TaxID=991905 RepID=F2J319_POLGS|nr:sugar kinase [Polymorphum gilvum]ADZ68889.1 Sugar kinase, ribokinase family [Polymorphum gilvum SL003B-26A1]